MTPPFKYKSAQMIALMNDPTLAAGKRREALESLHGPRSPTGTPRANHSAIRGCPSVTALPTDDLKDELSEILEASRVPIPPKLTPTGRLSKNQGPAFASQPGLVGSVRYGEIDEELRRRGHYPAAPEAKPVAQS